MADRPLSRTAFWEQHPLSQPFAETYERLMQPHQDRNEQYVDEQQWKAVSQAIEADYVRYLRRWARKRSDIL